MPGSGFLDLADAWRAIVSDTARTAYNWCKDNTVRLYFIPPIFVKIVRNLQESGKAEVPNLLGNIIQETGDEPSPEERENLTWAAVGTLGGGLDTVRTFHASQPMAKFGELSRTELVSHTQLYDGHDSVSRGAEKSPGGAQRRNRHRAPSTHQRSCKPAVHAQRRSGAAAVGKYRATWCVLIAWVCTADAANFAVAPGLPHTLREDDVYEGYHFSKGTVVIANIWYVFAEI